MNQNRLNDSKRYKRKLHYSEVRGDVLRPPHGIFNTSCNEVKYIDLKVTSTSRCFTDEVEDPYVDRAYICNLELHQNSE